MGMILNRAALADAFGVSLPAVDGWVRRGCPFERDSREYAFDSAAVHRWLVERATSAEEAGNDDEAEGYISRAEAERRKAVADALKAEHVFEQAKAEVAPVAMIERVVRAEFERAFVSILAIPAKLRPHAERMTESPDKTDRLVAKADGLVRDALTEIKSYGAPPA